MINPVQQRIQRDSQAKSIGVRTSCVKVLSEPVQAKEHKLNASALQRLSEDRLRHFSLR